jgi:hypothetical protein
VELRNSGNMRLANVAVDGDANDCSFALLEPSGVARCSMTRTLTQDAFDAGLVTLDAAAATANPRGPVTALVSIPSDSAAMPLNQTAAMDLSASVNQSYVAAAGDAVRVSFTLGNTGSVTLRGLQLSVSPALSSMTCDNINAAPAAAGDSVSLGVLSVDGSGSVVSCSGLLAFDQDALEAGPQYINVTGSGAAGNQTAAASSQLVAVVPLNLPGLLVDVVGSNCSLPGAAGGAVSCAVEVHNSGNVRAALSLAQALPAPLAAPLVCCHQVASSSARCSRKCHNLSLMQQMCMQHTQSALVSLVLLHPWATIAAR